MRSLDDPSRGPALRVLIQRKPALRRYYEEIYSRYAACLSRSPVEGIALEIGSGAGFVNDVLPGIMTSDTIPYEGIDRVVDARSLPFPDASLRAILMTNVFHHIPDVRAFLLEAVRCLKPSGRLLVVDQYPGWISTPILRHFHHEPFDPAARDWSFPSAGPLSGANGALAWIVFERDRRELERSVPGLRLERWEPHSPLVYWLAGGLKPWCLLPGRAFALAVRLDRAIIRLSPRWASFVDAELVRVASGGRLSASGDVR